MANQLSSNPWILDTTSDTTILWNHPLQHVQVEYYDYTNETDSVELQDKNGHTIWRGKGLNTLATVRSGRVGWVEGLKLPTTNSDGGGNMLSGKVIVYFE